MQYEKIFYLAGAYFGIIATYFFGGWGESLQFLAFLVVADYVTGLIAAFMEGKQYPNDPTKGINSSKGSWGIFKKVLMFLVIGVLHRLDMLLGLEENISLMIGGMYFYLFNELVSLTENLGRVGLPIPEQLKSGISVLKKRAGVEDEIPIREKGKPIDEPKSDTIKEEIKKEDILNLSEQIDTQVETKGRDMKNGAKR